MLFGAKEKPDIKTITANQFVNIKRIANDCLYTQDNHVFSYLKVASINTELMTEREAKTLVNSISAQLSTESKPIQFLILTQPDDVTEDLTMLNELRQEAEEGSVKRKLLDKEFQEISDYALAGDISTRQFYIVLWDKYKEDIEKTLIRRTLVLKNKLESGGLPSSLLTDQGIFKLMNLFSHPTSKYASAEDTDFSAHIPIIEWECDDEEE